MQVWEILNRSAALHPDRAAVWFREEWMTFQGVAEETDGVAAALVAIGVMPGDRVAILLENSFDYVVAHFGALRAGAVEVSLNTELKGESLAALMRDCQAKVLIAGSKYSRVWSPVLDKMPDLKHLVVDDARAIPADLDPRIRSHSLGEFRGRRAAEAAFPAREENDLASIVYTSGVTARPKGVMLSHRNLVSNTKSIIQYLDLTETDRMLVVLPFHYIYGRSLLYTHLLSGGSVVIDNRFAFPVSILHTMEAQEVTCFAGVPSTFSILLRKTDVKRRRFPHLRLVTQAGGGMAPALQREVAETFHPAELCVMYGSTEAAPRLTYLAPDRLAEKWGSIGQAIPGVEVWVADELGNRLPPRTEGEIVARGPNIMLGYWADPESSARVLRKDCYFTGDLGYADEEGFIFLTGRSRDVIKAGGNRISGQEIEHAIMENTEVLEVAVIGVPDEILGEAVKAFVVPRSAELTPELLRKDLGKRMPGFKVPKWLEFRKSLPKNQAGKVLKSLLKSIKLKEVED